MAELDSRSFEYVIVDDADNECGVDESLIHGQLGMMQLGIGGQIRQLSQIAAITHRMSCHTYSIASALPDNAVQRQRAKALRKVTAELKQTLQELEKSTDTIFL